MHENFWIAFGFTLMAGAGTMVGSAIAFLAKRTNFRFLSISTGFSAGVMLYVSFVEILPKGAETLAGRYGEELGQWIPL
jgi:ZIP family zinc transporter